MQTRSNGACGQLACKRDFVVAQAANFAHQKNITIDGAQAIESFSKCECQRLCGRQRWIRCSLDRLPPSSIVSHMIQCEIPRDAKQPGAPASLIGLRHGRPRHPKEHFLRQLARVLVSDDAAQIPEDSLPVRGEENVGVCHEVTLSPKDTGRGRSSQAAATRASAQVGK
jgi:hypothetical protein